MLYINSVPGGPKRFLKRFLNLAVIAVLLLSGIQWILSARYGFNSSLAINLIAVIFYLDIWAAILLAQPRMMAREGVSYAPEFFYSLHVPSALVMASGLVIIPMSIAYARQLLWLPLLVVPTGIFVLAVFCVPALLIAQKLHLMKMNREWREYWASQDPIAVKPQ